MWHTFSFVVILLSMHYWRLCRLSGFSCGLPGSHRKAAAMEMYRSIEEAWERQQEEKESKKVVEAAKRKVELEVMVRM